MRIGIRNPPAPAEYEARFVDIYLRCGKPVQAYCARRIPSPHVADAVAEVFLVAWRRIAEVPEGDATLPWLYGVAYRVVSHQWRQGGRSRRMRERLPGWLESEVAEPDVVIVRNEEYRMVLAAASRLRAVDQEILRLTLWEELSHADVAEVLGIDPAAVKQRAYRARRNLAREYQRMTKDRQPPIAPKGGGS
jgi:RNA polymerase sigma-70 factor (ECF subfamily)